MSWNPRVEEGERLILQEVEESTFAFIRERSGERVPVRAGLRLRVSLSSELSPKFDMHKTVRADVPRFGPDSLIYLVIGRHSLPLHQLGAGTVAEVLCVGELYGGITQELQREVSIRPRES